MYMSRAGRAVAGRLAPAARRTASTTSRSPASTRMPTICRRRSPIAISTTAGAAASRRKGLFSLSSWWKFGWDVTLESDDTFRRFYKLDNILLTDRVNKVFLTGMSDRNYFGAKLYHFGGLLFNDTPQSEIATPIRSSTTTTCSPIRSSAASSRWNTNALSFSSDQDPTTARRLSAATEQMNRVVTELNWRRRFTDPIGITYTPFAQLRGDIYQIEQLRRSAGSARADVHDTSLARGLALGGVTVAYPWVANARLRLARHRADRPDHRPPGQRRPATTCPTRTPRASCSTTPTCSSRTSSPATTASRRARAPTSACSTHSRPTTAAMRASSPARAIQLAGDNAYADPGRRRRRQSGVHARTAASRPTAPTTCSAPTSRPSSLFQLISQSRFDQSRLRPARAQDAGAQVDYGPLSASGHLRLPADRSDQRHRHRAAGHLRHARHQAHRPLEHRRRPCATTSTPTRSPPTWSRCATPTSASC